VPASLLGAVGGVLVSLPGGGVTATTVSSFTVAMIIVACLGLVWLLSRKAAEG
jgi:hypothetical protein